MKSYVLALKSHPWLLPACENALKSMPLHGTGDVAALFKTVRARGGRPVTDAEAIIALNALTDLGVLQRTENQFSLDRHKFVATEELRSGIQNALEILEGNQKVEITHAQLCVSLPPALAPATEQVIHESSSDLRSSLLDVVASATQTLIVASPFWDANTATDLVNLVKKKLAAGTQVSILGRFANELPTSVRDELKKISHHPGCVVLSWYKGTGADTETFHFKAVSADYGRRAYLGSANMTVSSLRSRMELGVILNGAISQQLDRILRVVLTLSTQVTLD
jgi:phosphatidylserine/phosphatidylglycerophosphate/cardiolipin synthase-like enzyme